MGSANLTSNLRASAWARPAALLLTAVAASCSSIFPHGRDQEPDFNEVVAPISADAFDPDRPFEDSRYMPRYTLNPGDSINFAFDVRAVETAEAYKIEPGDVLTITVLFHDEVGGTYNVRPDGMISLPYKGGFRIAGFSPEDAADELATLYSDIFVKPSVSIQLTSSGERIDNLRQVFNRGNTGQSMTYSLGPDGYVHLPIVGGFSAHELTVAQLESIVNSAYARMAPEVTVSVTLISTSGYGIFIQGEVLTPGRIPISSPTTAARALAMAGGANPETADLEHCILLSLDLASGQASAKYVDLKAVLTQGDFTRDALLGPNDVLIVPSTTITKLDRWVDQYIGKLLLFRGTSLGIGYRLETTNPPN